MNQAKENFQKLVKVITVFLETEKLFYASREKLDEIFADNLGQMMQVAFDLNLTPEKLTEFTQKTKDKKDLLAEAEFLGQTLENEQTYVLLNYYFYKFIQACLEIAPQENMEKLNKILEAEKLSEQEIKNILPEYQKLVAQKQ